MPVGAVGRGLGHGRCAAGRVGGAHARSVWGGPWVGWQADGRGPQFGGWWCGQGALGEGGRAACCLCVGGLSGVCGHPDLTIRLQSACMQVASGTIPAVSKGSEQGQAAAVRPPLLLLSPSPALELVRCCFCAYLWLPIEVKGHHLLVEKHLQRIWGHGWGQFG